MLFHVKSFVAVRGIVKTNQSSVTHTELEGSVLFIDTDMNLILPETKVEPGKQFFWNRLSLINKLHSQIS